MKQIKETRSIEISEYAGTKKPEFSDGEWVRVYCGPAEGHSFCIRETRFNADRDCFEYHYPMYGWYSANSLVPASSRKGWHYDSQGYCDNPGRGY